MLGTNYQGKIVSDCFSAYNLEVIAFSVNLENILKEGLSLKKGYQEGKYTLEQLQPGRKRLEGQISAVTSQALLKRKAEALRKRFVSHQDEIFTFLSYSEVEPTNNFAERQIRPAVVMRKNTGGSRSVKGAERLAVMLSPPQADGETPSRRLEHQNSTRFLLCIPGRRQKSLDSPCGVGNRVDYSTGIFAPELIHLQ